MGRFTLENHPILFDPVQRLENPLSWATHIPFAMLLMDLLRPRVLVELGVHTGNSYFAFCQAVRRLGLPTRCHGVDTWQGDPHAGFYDDAIYEDVAGYNQRFSDFSTLHRRPFDEAAPEFAAGQIELLHIDGLHTYEAVAHDYETWAPRVSPTSGVILFHDTQVRERGFGVWRFWREIADGATAYEFKHGSGLGVLAVGTALPEPFLDLIEQAAASPFLEDFFASRGTELVASHMLARDCRPRPERQARLYVDTGLGYNEKESFTKAVTAKRMAFAWDFPEDMPVKRIRFDPADDLCIVRLRRVAVNGEDLPLSDCLGPETNFLKQNDDVLFFGTLDPQIHIRLPATLQGPLARVALELEYVLEDEACCHRIVSLYDEILRQQACDLRHRDAMLAQTADELDRLKTEFARQGASFEEARRQFQATEDALRTEVSRRKYHLPNPKFWKILQPLRPLQAKLERFLGGCGRP
jgi:hypothetical protein